MKQRGYIDKFQVLLRCTHEECSKVYIYTPSNQMSTPKKAQNSQSWVNTFTKKHSKYMGATSALSNGS